jgi:hypothetical protein
LTPIFALFSSFCTDRRSLQSLQKRERVERAGSRSRPKSAMKAPAQGIPDEYGDKIDDLVVAEAPPGKADLLADSIEDSWQGTR